MSAWEEINKRISHIRRFCDVFGHSIIDEANWAELQRRMGYLESHVIVILVHLYVVYGRGANQPRVRDRIQREIQRTFVLNKLRFSLDCSSNSLLV